MSDIVLEDIRRKRASRAATEAIYCPRPILITHHPPILPPDCKTMVRMKRMSAIIKMITVVMAIALGTYPMKKTTVRMRRIHVDPPTQARSPWDLEHRAPYL